MKKVVSLVIASVLSLISIVLLFYFAVQTIVLVSSADTQVTSFPWYGFVPGIVLLALVAVPLILLACFEISDLRKGHDSRAMVSDGDKRIFWTSLSLLVVLLAIYIFFVSFYVSGTNVWFSPLGSDLDVVVFSLVVALAAAYPVWNCLSFNPFRKAKITA